MRIYNEVVTIFNESTGLWETLSEDSFEYNGPMAMAQGGMPPNASAINTSDTIADTRKVTAGYFTDGDGTISGDEIFTGSIADKNEKYYFNINQKVHTDSDSETQFSVTFGHYAGSGSDTYGDSTDNPNTLNGETQAIYNQLATTLLGINEASGGFKISSSTTANTSGDKDDYIYALVGRRDRFKDRLNKKAWTLVLSGSNYAGTMGSLTLTDDSKTVAAVATPGGPRYNIVAGELGVVTTAATSKCYGWIYPEMGIMVFSGKQLAADLPGPGADQHITASCIQSASAKDQSSTDWGNTHSSSGFLPNTASRGNYKNALRLARCMRNVGGGTTLRLRSEEDQTQENYFCRIRAEQYNFSANHTFVSGSKNKIRNLDMHGDPQTFITGVGLFNSSGQLLAVAKLSKPLLKNFASEATIKVKLTY